MITFSLCWGNEKVNDYYNVEFPELTFEKKSSKGA